MIDRMKMYESLMQNFLPPYKPLGNLTFNMYGENLSEMLANPLTNDMMSKLKDLSPEQTEILRKAIAKGANVLEEVARIVKENNESQLPPESAPDNPSTQEPAPSTADYTPDPVQTPSTADYIPDTPQARPDTPQPSPSTAEGEPGIPQKVPNAKQPTTADAKPPVQDKDADAKEGTNVEAKKPENSKNLFEKWAAEEREATSKPGKSWDDAKKEWIEAERNPEKGGIEYL